MTVTWRIQALVCILLQLTLFQPGQSCLDYEQICVEKIDSFDTREHAELIVNCSMNYATLMVNQLNKDFNELLQVEYVCKNIITQDEKYSCILAINNLQNLDDKIYNITIPHGSFCLIRGCIQDGWSYYYLATNNIRCDGHKNIPLTSSVIIGLSSSADITTQSSNYSTNTHQTILNPTVTYTTSMNEQTGLHSSTISSLVFSKGISSTSLSSSKPASISSTGSTSLPGSSTITTSIFSTSGRIYPTIFPSSTIDTFPSNSTVASSTVSINLQLSSDVIVTYIDLVMEVSSFVVIITFIAVCVAFCLKRWYKKRQKKKTIANQCLPIESPSQAPVIYVPTCDLTTSSSAKSQYYDVIKSDHDWKLSQPSISSEKAV